MADRAAAPGDPAERAQLDGEHRLIRSVRWRLVAWSGLTTLIVLLILGVALYGIVARSLAAEATERLEERATEIRQAVARGRPGPALGQIFGGRATGTIAMLVDAEGRSIVRGAQALPDGLPEPDSIAAAAATAGQDVRTSTVETAAGGVPVRVLTEQLATNAGPVYLQVVADRVAEQRTLGAMLGVLLVGGGMVILASLAAGAVYAQRALIPIRESLANQRAALRRQREFAADASHELRTPLTVVRASVEHLRRHPDAPVREVAEAVEDIDAEVTHLTTLVEDLLLLARSDSGVLSVDLRPVDVGEVVGEAIGGLGAAASGRGVTIRLEAGPVVVPADAARVRQLVTILVDNALRHSPHGGEIRVTVGSEGAAAVIEVGDDGPGIRPSDLPHLFDRFWRARGAPAGGTGLGLSIARTIAEAHGGRILVDSGQGRGACFRVVLPGAPA